MCCAYAHSWHTIIALVCYIVFIYRLLTFAIWSPSSSAFSCKRLRVWFGSIWSRTQMILQKILISRKLFHIPEIRQCCCWLFLTRLLLLCCNTKNKNNLFRQAKKIQNRKKTKVEDDEKTIWDFFLVVNVPYLNVHSWQCDKQIKKLRVAWQRTTWYMEYTCARRDEKHNRARHKILCTFV